MQYMFELNENIDKNIVDETDKIFSVSLKPFIQTAPIAISI